MPKENTTRYILLGLLSHQPLSGYDIKKRVDLSIQPFWPVGFGQIYPTLGLLEREGLVTLSTVESDKGPQRKVYSVTEAGRQALRAWLMTPEEKEYVRYELLLKLFFSAELPAQNSVDRVEAFARRHEANLRLMRLFKEELGGILATSDDHLYYYLTVLFGEQVYAAYLNWADQAVALLRARQNDDSPMERNETP